VFEKRVLRRIFGPKEKVRGCKRKVHNEDLHNIYSSPNIIRMFKSKRMNGWDTCSSLGRFEKCIQIFYQKT
jgi:hypothetical protein